MATGGSPILDVPQRESRVHFPDDQVRQHDSNIVIEKGASDSELHVHLGFLQLNHRYRIKFDIKDTLGDAVMWDSSKTGCAALIEAKYISGAEGYEGHQVLLDFRSNKEKLVTEELLLRNSNNDKQLILILHARILGKDKGTPALREGIHCIEKDESNDLESQRSEYVRDDEFKALD